MIKTLKTSQYIAYIGLLSALATVGRLLFQPIPNVQPVTVIIMVVTLQLGWWAGTAVAIISMLLSNIFMGMGTWLLSQWLSYLILTTVVFFFHPFYPVRTCYRQVLFIGLAILLGFVYGFVISVVSVYTFQINHFWLYYLRGLSFDSLHGIGNGLFYFILEPILRRLFEKQGFSRS